MPELVNLQIVEQVPGSYLFLLSRQEYPEIIPYHDMVGDIVVVDKTEPVIPYKFPIS